MNEGRFENFSDEDWLAALIASVDSGSSELPGFPAIEIQAQFVGRHGGSALEEVYPFYKTIKEKSDIRTGPILDFGVGWGRLIRFFLKDVTAERLYGVDVDQDILDICRQMRVPGHLARVDPLGTLPYESRTVGTVYAYSVFTHLSPTAADHWVREIKRVLRPGGTFIYTALTPRFLQLCIESKRAASAPWQQTLAAIFPDPSEQLAKYNRGEFVYAPTGGGTSRDASMYGWAAVPLAYMQGNWGLTTIEAVDDSARFQQGVYIYKSP